MRQKFDPSSLFMDENGVMFHMGPEKLGGVAAIKSPGLAELIFEKISYEDDVIKAYDGIPVDNLELQNKLNLLIEYNLLGNTLH